jgi:hypothetical protein
VNNLVAVLPLILLGRASAPPPEPAPPRKVVAMSNENIKRALWECKQQGLKGKVVYVKRNSTNEFLPVNVVCF